MNKVKYRVIDPNEVRDTLDGPDTQNDEVLEAKAESLALADKLEELKQELSDMREERDNLQHDLDNYECNCMDDHNCSDNCGCFDDHDCRSDEGVLADSEKLVAVRDMAQALVDHIDNGGDFKARGPLDDLREMLLAEKS